MQNLVQEYQKQDPPMYIVTLLLVNYGLSSLDGISSLNMLSVILEISYKMSNQEFNYSAFDAFAQEQFVSN